MKLNRANGGSLAAVPLTVRPRTHHQSVVDSRILRPGGAERFEGSRQVLAVKPSADRKHRCAHIVEMLGDVAGLAPGGVARVGNEVVPERNLPLEITVPQGRERSALEVEAISIRSAVVEVAGLLARGGFEFLLKPVHEAPIVAQPEGPSVQGVVAIQ